LPPPWLPAEPGKASCRADERGGVLANAALRYAVARRNGALAPSAFDNLWTHAEHALRGELFSLELAEKKRLAASQLRAGELSCANVAADAKASRLAERSSGVALSADLVDEAAGLTVHWRAVLRDGANYVRQETTFTAATDTKVPRVRLIDLDLPGAYAVGLVQGSPLAADDRFFGVEHPMAELPRIEGGHAVQFIGRVLPLRAHVATTYASVLGVTTPGQLRRTFAAYVERERAHPFRTFLHYNSWYDIGYFTPYTESDARAAIDAYVQKLGRERGVQLDSFLFDDGWDDYEHLWRFNAGFPRGFAPLAAAADSTGAGVGMWLSPWGGYGEPRQRRLAAAKAAGYEVDEQGLALSGPKYYALFHDRMLELLTQAHVNQFKLDGTGSPDKVTPGSAFDSDFAAAIALIADLRAVQPELFINLTTGTWPSPFWLRAADSIWRGGEDHEFAGQGSDRQRWITYRDADTYGGIVRQAPLYPLNSLMLHGIIYAKHARGLDVSPDPNDFRDEVRDYFASGTGLQEMYVSPELLKDADWDVLAAAAKWARANAEVLRDSHWIGGDPARGEVYGWGAWSPRKSILTLRNPDVRPRRASIELRRDLELPEQTSAGFRVVDLWSSHAALPRQIAADETVTIVLAPFEVLTLELTPLP
jgi:hypothetical protein